MLLVCHPKPIIEYLAVEKLEETVSLFLIALLFALLESAAVGESHLPPTELRWSCNLETQKLQLAVLALLPEDARVFHCNRKCLLGGV